MNYEEKIVAGVLCCRYNELESWMPVPIETVTARYQEQKERADLWKLKFEAMEKFIKRYSND